MIAQSLVALALAASTVTPLTTATPGPLRVIVRVKATSPCAQMATHANAAILLTLRNDVTLQQTISQLQNVHLSPNNEIQRQVGMNELLTLAGRLVRSSHDADHETQKILDYAKTLKDPKERARLIAFVQAIGGAVGRQRKIARDLGGFVAAIQGYKAMRWMNDELAGGSWNRDTYVPNPQTNMNYGGGDPMYRYAEGSPSLMPTLSNDQLAARAAKAFERRLPAIALDEASASTPIQSAAEHC